MHLKKQVSAEVHEECGIAAVSLKGSLAASKIHASAYLYRLLLQQQNRGQLGAGITTFNPSKPKLLDTHRDLGLVNSVFKTHDESKHRQLFERLNGLRGIGHVRYATFGLDTKSYVQPFEHRHGRKWKWFSFAFNGNIVNYWDIRKALEEKQFHFSLESDTEVLMHCLAFGCRGESNRPLEEVFSEVNTQIDGAYSLAFINAYGEMGIGRDPHGFKPLCLAENDSLIGMASESNALESIGLEKIQSIEPGEMALVTDAGIEKKRFAPCRQKSHCMFEWVYFSNPTSTIENQNVYDSRYRLGIELAKQEPNEWSSETIVVPIPEASRPSADGYAYQLGLPVKEGIIKNNYVGRTFIETSHRAEKVRNKFSLNKKIVENKKVILVEDSIVRGTTAQEIARFLKEKGRAEEVHLRSSCPPIFFPCFYGIDMSTTNEFIATRNRKEVFFGSCALSPEEEQKIALEIGADSVHYQSLEGLVKAIGLPKNELCLGCLTGRYPTPKANELIQNGALQQDSRARIYQANSK